MPNTEATASATPARRSGRSRWSAGIAAVGIAALLAGCSSTPAAESASSDTELTTLKVALGWITNVEWAGFWAADAAGYYEDEGLKIEWQGGGPNAPTTMASVASGTADIGVEANTQALLQSIPEGNEFTLMGSVFQTSPSALVSLADNPVRTAEDLVGKTVLGQEGTQQQIDAILAINGLEKDYDYVTAGFDPGPLVEGAGDVYTAYLTNQPIILEESYGLSEDDYVVTTIADLGLPLYGSTIYTEADTLAADRDAMVGFLRATAKGWQDNEADPDANAELAVDVYGADLGLDINQQIRENRLQIPLTQSDLTDEKGLLYMDPAVLGGEMYDGLRAAGISELPDVDTILDLTLLDEIYADGPIAK